VKERVGRPSKSELNTRKVAEEKWYLENRRELVEKNKRQQAEILTENGAGMLPLKKGNSIEEQLGFGTPAALTASKKKMDDLRFRMENDIYFLAKEVVGWDKDYLDDNFHAEACRTLDEWFRKYPRIIMHWPREHLKTSLITVTGSVQEILRARAEITIAIINANENNACDMLGQIGNIFRSNEIIHLLYPEMIPDFNNTVWRDSAILLKRKGTWKEKTVEAFGAGSDITGRHYHLGILDDIVSFKNSRSVAERQYIRDWYKQFLSIQGAKGRIWIPSTRYHNDDLYGHLRKTGNYAISFYTCYKNAGAAGDPVYKRFTKESLDRIKKEQGSYVFNCTPGWAKVWMADGSFKQIKEVGAGEVVIGFRKDVGLRTRMVKSKVIETNSRMARIVKVKMESGRDIFCTPEHKWFMGKEDKTHAMYLPAKVGRELMFVVSDPGDCPRDAIGDAWKWLGGFFDGEGSCNCSNINIAQSRHANSDCYNKMISVLKFLGIGFKEYYHKNKHDCSIIALDHDREFKAKFVNWGKPAKSDRLMNHLFRHGGRMVKERDRVVEIIDAGECEVFALTTETNNYISQGYASKNCQYLNRAIPEEEITFKERFSSKFTDLPEKVTHYLLVDQVNPEIKVESDTKDNAVVLDVAVSSDSHWYINDYVCKRMQPSELISTIIKMQWKYKPVKVGCGAVGYERVIEHDIKELEKKRSIYIPFSLVPNKNRAKKERIISMEPKWSRGEIHHRDWMSDFEEELFMFPGQTDDILDALALLPDVLVNIYGGEEHGDLDEYEYEPIDDAVNY
jgi:hypothetical protein